MTDRDFIARVSDNCLDEQLIALRELRVVYENHQTMSVSTSRWPTCTEQSIAHR